MTLSVDPKINWTMDVMPSAIQMENFPVAGLTVAGAETRGTETETIVIVVKTVWITGITNLTNIKSVLLFTNLQCLRK